MKVTRAYNLKIEDVSLIQSLDYLYLILENELVNILNNDNIKLNSFSEKEYSNSYKGEFYSKLAELTNKSYLNWNHVQPAKYFRMLANNIRMNFKSIKDKNEIAKICSKYNWDYNINKEKIREELKNKNLYPTFAHIKNICRSQIVPDKHSEFRIKLDYSYSQDKQTILQENTLIPSYSFNLNDKWHFFEAIVPNYLNKINITKFCKPSFYKNKNDNDSWWITIPYEQQMGSKSSNEFIMGIDLGKVKSFSARIINSKSREIVGRELAASRETNNLNNKIRRLENNRNDCYSKVDRYNYIIKTSKKDTTDLLNKRIRLELEIYYLKKKISILKVRLGRLMARDINYFVKKYNVSIVKLERLNFVENTGGKWDFSQQQSFISEKLETIGIKTKKVNASHTSDQNPFIEEYELGKKSNRIITFKDFSIDRDVLAGINIASRPLKEEEERIVIKKSNLINSNYELAKVS